MLWGEWGWDKRGWDKLASMLCVSVSGFVAGLEPWVEIPCGARAPGGWMQLSGGMDPGAYGCVAFLSVLQLTPAGLVPSFPGEPDA